MKIKEAIDKVVLGEFIDTTLNCLLEEEQYNEADFYAERVVCASINPGYDTKGMKAFSIYNEPGYYGVHVGDWEEWLPILVSEGYSGDAYIYEIDFDKWNSESNNKFYYMEDPDPINKENVPDSMVVFSKMNTIPASIVKLVKVIPEEDLMSLVSEITDTDLGEYYI